MLWSPLVPVRSHHPYVHYSTICSSQGADTPFEWWLCHLLCDLRQHSPPHKSVFSFFTYKSGKNSRHFNEILWGLNLIKLIPSMMGEVTGTLCPLETAGYLLSMDRGICAHIISYQVLFVSVLPFSQFCWLLLKAFPTQWRGLVNKGKHTLQWKLLRNVHSPSPHPWPQASDQ